MEKIVGKRWLAKGNKDYPFKAWRNPGSSCADNGYVLIFVLWAVVILGFVASGFSGSTRNAIKLEKATVERTKNLYATRGATIYAMSKVAGVSALEDEDEFPEDEYDEGDEEYREDADAGDESFGKAPPPRSPRRNPSRGKGGSVDDRAPRTAEENKDISDGSNKEVPEDPPWVPNLTPYSVFIGDKECKVYIEDESGKINVNVIDDNNRDVLVRYLTGQGFGLVEADIITDSVLDWKDGDDLKHLNGAEKDYYESLEEPYEAKNAPFDSLEEFALIKGMTPDKFDKIRRDITIYGNTLAININFASREALTAIPRITHEGADYIITHRTQYGLLKSMEDVRNLFWHLGIVGSIFEEIKPYITVDNSGFMTIRTMCEANNVSSTYRAIISKAGNSVKVFAVYPD